MWGRNWELGWGVGEVLGMWGSMEEVWKSEWSECGGCVEVGKVCWEAERCGDVGEPTHSSTPFPTPSTLTRHLFPHSPDTSLHTFPHSPPTSPHSLTLPTPLFPHFSFTSPNTFPHSLPILPHNPHASSNTSLCSPYFIIYLMPQFLTFLIYCQISLTIKYTKNFL